VEFSETGIIEFFDDNKLNYTKEGSTFKTFGLTPEITIHNRDIFAPQQDFSDTGLSDPLGNVMLNKFYCQIRLRGLLLRGQNDKNLAIFGHFRAVCSSKRTKRGVKIVVRNKKL
jgi:hypothetical protein